MGTSVGAAGGVGDGTRLLGSGATRGAFGASRGVVVSGISVVGLVGGAGSEGSSLRWQKSSQRLFQIFIARASMSAGVVQGNEAA